jgi:hypothetical protein
MPWSSEWSLSLWLSHQNLFESFIAPYVPYNRNLRPTLLLLNKEIIVEQLFCPFPGGKAWQGHDADHSSPTSTMVKNE